LAEVAATLEKLREEGKIRHFGVSNHNVEQFRAQRRYADYSVVQPPYSLVDTAIEEELLPYCQAENIGVMVYSPMHKGLLSGKYSGEETFDDFRKNHLDFQGERFKELCAAVDSLRPMAGDYGMTPYQLILAATLMHPAIHVAICGIKTITHIEEAVGAAGKKLSREDYFTIRNTLACGRGTKVLDAKGTRK
jgi:aryl-alcohol dehydrogenase-like predicted oxidoreductase